MNFIENKKYAKKFINETKKRKVKKNPTPWEMKLSHRNQITVGRVLK